MKLILGSASLRRQELLKRISNEFEVVVSDFDEQSIGFNGNCEEYVIELAKGKVVDVINKINDEAVVIGCDTIVYFNDKIMGKPNDEKEAFDMLNKLSGNVHKVYSGIVTMNSITGDFREACVCTEVKFSKLTTEQIQNYIKTGDPLDKAGSYGIQGDAAVFVEEIHGCYYSVVGLPLNKLNYLLGDMGVNLNKE